MNEAAWVAFGAPVFMSVAFALYLWIMARRTLRSPSGRRDRSEPPATPAE